MAVKKPEVPASRQVTLTLTEPGSTTLMASYVWSHYRFLLGDGRTFDVIAIRDDSDLRGAVLEATAADQIAGVATLEVVHMGPVH